MGKKIQKKTGELEPWTKIRNFFFVAVHIHSFMLLAFHRCNIVSNSSSNSLIVLIDFVFVFQQLLSFICFLICLDLSNNNLSCCCCFWRAINFKPPTNVFGEIFFCLNWNIDLKTSEYYAQCATKKFRW